MINSVIQISFLELAAFLGVAHTVYVLVHIFFRSNNFSRAIFPVLFYLILGGAFLLVLLTRQWSLDLVLYQPITLLFWTLCAPVSSFLALQISTINKPPPIKYGPTLIFIPILFAFIAVFSIEKANYDLNILYVFSILIGSISLLAVWFKRDLMDQLHKRKNGRERFWLIMALITLNIALVATNFINLIGIENHGHAELIRVVLGLSFLYVTSTSLFRVYPPTISMVNKSLEPQALKSEDIEIALKIEDLLHIQNVYQEPSYGRSEMAKELDVSETQLSRIVNGYFQKTVPVLLNSLRVEEAKTLLIETDEDISLISEESGFNSIATFNRVFKSMVAVSPKDYRQKHK